PLLSGTRGSGRRRLLRLRRVDVVIEHELPGVERARVGFTARGGLWALGGVLLAAALHRAYGRLGQVGLRRIAVGHRRSSVFSRPAVRLWWLTACHPPPPTPVSVRSPRRPRRRSDERPGALVGVIWLSSILIDYPDRAALVGLRL